MYKWSEMSVIQKVFCAAGWISAAAWLVLEMLEYTGILVDTKAFQLALFGVWCLGNGSLYKIRWLSVIFYILSGAFFALCFWRLLISRM